MRSTGMAWRESCSSSTRESPRGGEVGSRGGKEAGNEPGDGICRRALPPRGGTYGMLRAGGKRREGGEHRRSAPRGRGDGPCSLGRHGRGSRRDGEPFPEIRRPREIRVRRHGGRSVRHRMGTGEKGGPAGPRGHPRSRGNKEKSGGLSRDGQG